MWVSDRESMLEAVNKHLSSWSEDELKNLSAMVSTSVLHRPASASEAKTNLDESQLEAARRK